MRIQKLELTFWLLTSLRSAQPYGIRVVVNKLANLKPKVATAMYSA